MYLFQDTLNLVGSVIAIFSSLVGALVSIVFLLNRQSAKKRQTLTPEEIILEEIDNQQLERQRKDALNTVIPPEIEALLSGRARLQQEAKRIRSSANTNLGSGIIFSAAAISLLFYFAVSYQYDAQTDIGHIAISFLPRLLLSLLVQTIGFFFLRIYVSGESELISNRNEITNIDLRVAAIYLSYKSPKSVIGKVVMGLMQQERNVIIKKTERALTPMIDSIDRNEAIELFSALYREKHDKRDNSADEKAS